MQNFKKMSYQTEVRALLSCADSARSIVSESLPRIELTLDGIPGDTHAGLTRRACTRFPYLYEEGSEIRNSRQLTIVSTEELAEIADAMQIDELLPGWLGANIELAGIPSLTLLPPSTRLVFASGATLVVDLENRPCVYPAQVIDGHYPGRGRRFVRSAMHRRGITAWVERAGAITVGDGLEVYFPEQKAHPAAVGADTAS